MNPEKQPFLTADPQQKSLLFEHLPQELRDKIYSQLFFSTELIFGEGRVFQTHSTRTKPAPNALSILQTCRRAKREIGDAWISQVLFSFNNSETMLDILTTLPLVILSEIRYLCVPSYPLILFYKEDSVSYRLASALRLLPSLRLDILTVLSRRPNEVSYNTLNGLITESCGWKELHYISDNSEVLGFARLRSLHSADGVISYAYWRKPQPAHWQGVLEDRDGVISRPSINIYRSTISGCPGSVMNETTRERFEQKIPKDTASQEAFGVTEDAGLMADGERDKAIIFIVKRGAGVDYEQKNDSPFIGRDIRQDMPGKTWQEIQYECNERSFPDEDNLLLGYGEYGEGIDVSEPDDDDFAIPLFVVD